MGVFAIFRASKTKLNSFQVEHHVKILAYLSASFQCIFWQRIVTLPEYFCTTDWTHNSPWYHKKKKKLYRQICLKFSSLYIIITVMRTMDKINVIVHNTCKIPLNPWLFFPRVYNIWKNVAVFPVPPLKPHLWHPSAHFPSIRFHSYVLLSAAALFPVRFLWGYQIKIILWNAWNLFCFIPNIANRMRKNAVRCSRKSRSLGVISKGANSSSSVNCWGSELKHEISEME